MNTDSQKVSYIIGRQLGEDFTKQGFVLTPGRYVGVPEEEDNGIPFEEKMARLVKDYRESVDEGNRLDKEIEGNLKGLGAW